MHFFNALTIVWLQSNFIRPREGSHLYIFYLLSSNLGKSHQQQLLSFINNSAGQRENMYISLFNFKVVQI